MAIKAGWQYKLYRNTGSYGSPTWNEVDNIADLTLQRGGDEDDITTRRHGGIKAVKLALLDVGATFTMMSDEADADFAAVSAAYFARTTIDVAVVNGDINVSGTKGVRFVAAVTGFEENQDVGKFARTSVTLKPGDIEDSTQAPVTWTTA